MSSSNSIWHIAEYNPRTDEQQNIQQAYTAQPDRSLPDLQSGFRVYQHGRRTTPHPSYFYIDDGMRMGATQELNPDMMDWEISYESKNDGQIRYLDVPSLRKVRTTMDGIPLGGNEPEPFPNPDSYSSLVPGGSLYYEPQRGLTFDQAFQQAEQARKNQVQDAPRQQQGNGYGEQDPGNRTERNDTQRSGWNQFQNVDGLNGQGGGEGGDAQDRKEEEAMQLIQKEKKNELKQYLDSLDADQKDYLEKNPFQFFIDEPLLRNLLPDELGMVSDSFTGMLAYLTWNKDAMDEKEALQVKDLLKTLVLAEDPSMYMERVKHQIETMMNLNLGKGPDASPLVTQESKAVNIHQPLDILDKTVPVTDVGLWVKQTQELTMKQMLPNGIDSVYSNIYRLDHMEKGTDSYKIVDNYFQQNMGMSAAEFLAKQSVPGLNQMLADSYVIGDNPNLWKAIDAYILAKSGRERPANIVGARVLLAGLVDPTTATKVTYDPKGIVTPDPWFKAGNIYMINQLKNYDMGEKWSQDPQAVYFLEYALDHAGEVRFFSTELFDNEPSYHEQLVQQWTGSGDKLMNVAQHNALAAFNTIRLNSVKDLDRFWRLHQYMDNMYNIANVDLQVLGVPQDVLYRDVHLHVKVAIFRNYFFKISNALLRNKVPGDVADKILLQLTGFVRILSTADPLVRKDFNAVLNDPADFNKTYMHGKTLQEKFGLNHEIPPDLSDRIIGLNRIIRYAIGGEGHNLKERASMIQLMESAFIQMETTASRGNKYPQVEYVFGGNSDQLELDNRENPSSWIKHSIKNRDAKLKALLEFTPAYKKLWNKMSEGYMNVNYFVRQPWLSYASGAMRVYGYLGAFAGGMDQLAKLDEEKIIREKATDDQLAKASNYQAQAINRINAGFDDGIAPGLLNIMKEPGYAASNMYDYITGNVEKQVVNPIMVQADVLKVPVAMGVGFSKNMVQYFGWMGSLAMAGGKLFLSTQAAHPAVLGTVFLAVIANNVVFEYASVKAKHKGEFWVSMQEYLISRANLNQRDARRALKGGMVLATTILGADLEGMNSTDYGIRLRKKLDNEFLAKYPNAPLGRINAVWDEGMKLMAPLVETNDEKQIDDFKEAVDYYEKERLINPSRVPEIPPELQEKRIDMQNQRIRGAVRTADALVGETDVRVIQFENNTTEIKERIRDDVRERMLSQVDPIIHQSSPAWAIGLYARNNPDLMIDIVALAKLADNGIQLMGLLNDVVSRSRLDARDLGQVIIDILNARF